MYQEYPPDIRLSHLIETYWVADGLIEDSVSQRILPDGCVDVIFDFHSENGAVLPKLIGTMTSLLEIVYQPGRVQMMGIRFAPGGITAFTRMPVFEVTNRNVELSLTETLFSSSFYDSLPEITKIHERIAHLNRYLIALLPELYLPEKQIDYAVSLIQNAHGQLSVKQLAAKTCLCERHFERKFKAAIGISPKLFSNVMRFQFARRYMKTYKEDSLFSVSIACGYHDLSHMNKEFQRLGSMMPSDLQKSGFYKDTPESKPYLCGLSNNSNV